MAHDRMHELTLIKPLLAALDILLGNTPLAEINVALLLVDTKDHDGLDAADFDKAADAPNAAAGQLREEDHALDIVVLQESDVRAAVGHALHLYHNRLIHLRVPRLVHPALQVGPGARHG